MKTRLSVLISLLLVMSALVSSLLLFFREVQLANARIEDEALNDINITLTHLQNVMNTQLTLGNLEDARLSMSVSALHRDVRTLLLSDDQDKVFLANRYNWEGMPAAKVSGYRPDSAQQVRRSHASTALIDRQRELLSGYYPVTLKLGTGGTSVSRVGVLFVEYDLSAKLAQARYDARMQASVLGGLLLAVAILVAMLLQRLVTRPVASPVAIWMRARRSRAMTNLPNWARRSTTWPASARRSKPPCA